MEQMEIGELGTQFGAWLRCPIFPAFLIRSTISGLEIWKKNMIEPLQNNLVSAILECINEDRKHAVLSVNAETVRGVIESFVGVNKFKKRNSIEVNTFSWSMPNVQLVETVTTFVSVVQNGAGETVSRRKQ